MLLKDKVAIITGGKVETYLTKSHDPEPFERRNKQCVNSTSLA